MFKFSTIFAQNLQVDYKFLTCLCQHNAKMALNFFMLIYYFYVKTC